MRELLTLHSQSRCFILCGTERLCRQFARECLTLLDSVALPDHRQPGGTTLLQALRGIRDFTREQGCAVGVVVSNDTVPRQIEDRLIGVPFTHL